MMTKTSNTKKSSAMARVALGATAALALAGHAHAACATSEYLVMPTGVTTAGKGTCTTCPAGTISSTAANERTATANTFCNNIATGYYGTVGVLASSHAVVTKCPTGSSSTTSGATNTIGACSTSAGYYLQVASTTAPVISMAPAGWFAAGGEIVSTSTKVVNVAPSALDEATGITNTASAYSNAKIQPCTAVFTSAQIGSLTSEVGSSAKTACKVKSGYYIVTVRGAADANLVTAKVPANSYQAALADATTGTAGVTACPFAGTSPAGSTKESQCTPDCATTWTASNAVALDGTCVCKAGTYGTVKDIAGNAAAASTGGAYDGCTACSKTFASADAAGITSEIKSASANTDCVTAPGYLVSDPSNSDSLVKITQAPANSYAPGSSSLTNTNSPEAATQCPKNSVSAAGSNDITDCTCVAEYASTASSCEYCPGTAAGTAVGTHTTCAEGYVIKTSGASGVSVLAAISAVVAAQLVL